MRTKEDWSMREWRDYYEKLRKKAYMDFQETGINRYDREEMRYSIIVDAFNGYLENKSEVDDEKLRRRHNIEAYAESHVYKDTYTKAEVLAILNTVKDF